MGVAPIEEFLTGDSEEIQDLANNQAALVGFLTLLKRIDDLPDMSTRFYETSRSLYQVTSSGRAIQELVAILREFFGAPAKAPGKSLPVSLRFDPTLKHLGGVRKDQALFLKKIKTGSFYGALWPWQRDADKIEVHLGYYSASMNNEDYSQLEMLVQKFLSKKKIETVSEVGGQIHGISLPSFLQMSEMEGATYTLKVTSGNRSGHLYLDGGSLIAAQYNDQVGNAAAYRIISWDQASIQIEAADPKREREIHDPLMHVMMESIKIKDEAGAKQAPPATPPPPPPETKSATVSPDRSEAKKDTPPIDKRVKKTTPPVRKKPFVKPASTPSTAKSMASVPFEKATDQSAGKQDQMKRTSKLLIVLGLVIVFAIIVSVSGSWLKKRQVNRRYDRLIENLAGTDALDAQIVLLMQYLKAYPEDPHRLELEARLEQANAEIETKDYEKTIVDVNRLPIDDQYEKRALSLYTAFLANYPQSRYAKQIHEAIGGIRQLLGKAQFEDLKKVSNSDFITRYAAYRNYLEQFPEGKQRNAVKQMITDLAQEYSDIIKEQAIACDAQESWDDCIAQCDRFLSVFTDAPAVETVKIIRTELIDKKELQALIKQAALIADNPAKTKKLYTDYLQKRPDTTQKEAITQRLNSLNADLKSQAEWEKTAAYVTNPANDIFSRIERLDKYLQTHASGTYVAQANALRSQLDPDLQDAVRRQQIEATRRQVLARQQAEQARRTQEAQRIQRLQEQMSRQLRPLADRFVDRRNGTVTDRVTGLMWCLLDSYLVLGKCISYTTANEYVQNLDTGGYTDWRLPDAGELATLYKNSPFFPGSGAEWYWTSEYFARGYHQVVDVVTSIPETVFTRTSKSENDCGAVRAVRK